MSDNNTPLSFEELLTKIKGEMKDSDQARKTEIENSLKKLQNEMNNTIQKLETAKESKILDQARIDELKILNDDIRMKYSILHEEYTKTFEMSSEHRDENIGLLKYKVERRNSIKEEFMAWWYDFATIEQGWKHFKKLDIPWNTVSLAAVVVAAIIMLTVNPDYADTAKTFFNTPQNQYFIIIIIVLIIIGAYYFYRKKKSI